MDQLHENEKRRLEIERLAVEERTKRAQAKEDRKIKLAEIASQAAARSETATLYPLFLSAHAAGIPAASKGFQVWLRDYKGEEVYTEEGSVFASSSHQPHV